MRRRSPTSPSRRFSTPPAFADNVTKVWKTHTIKVGGFTELVGNDGAGYEYPNGQLYVGNGPAPNKVVGSTVSPTTLIGSTNPTANLVQGIVSGFDQNSYENNQDLASRTTSVYVMDDWKFNRRLTVNVGVRWDHVGRWYDRQGVARRPGWPGRRRVSVLLTTCKARARPSSAAAGVNMCGTIWSAAR